MITTKSCSFFNESMDTHLIPFDYLIFFPLCLFNKRVESEGEGG